MSSQNETAAAYLRDALKSVEEAIFGNFGFPLAAAKYKLIEAMNCLQEERSTLPGMLMMQATSRLQYIHTLETKLKELETALATAQGLIRMVVDTDTVALMDMQDMGIKIEAPPITQMLRGYLAGVASKAAEAQNGPLPGAAGLTRPDSSPPAGDGHAES